MKKDEFFYRLTPDIIIQAVEDAGYMTTGLCWQLNSLENRVYDLKLEDKSHIVVKFYRPGRWSEKQIQEEHDFLFDLQDGEVPVCAPFRFSDGMSIKKIEGIYYTVWPRTGGRSVDEFSDEQLRMLGRLIGRIHMVGKSQKSIHRLSLTADNLGTKPLDFLIKKGFIPSPLIKRFSQAVKTVCSIFNERIIDVPYHRIHGDCHIGNILLGEYGFYFLDFDDFYQGPAVQDLWMLIPERVDTGRNKLDRLLEGYRTFCPFEEKWLSLIEPLRTLRFIHYSAWISKRWMDPAFKAAFPHFGSEEYWQNEVIDLEKQIDLMKKPIFSMPGTIEEPEEGDKDEEMSNKDFFWDWEE